MPTRYDEAVIAFNWRWVMDGYDDLAKPVEIPAKEIDEEWFEENVIKGMQRPWLEYQRIYYTAGSSFTDFDPNPYAIKDFINNHNPNYTLLDVPRFDVRVYYQEKVYQVNYDLGVDFASLPKEALTTFSYSARPNTAIPVPTLSKDTDLVFKQWEYEGTPVTNYPFSEGKDITLKARWDNQYFITYERTENFDNPNPTSFFKGDGSIELKPLALDEKEGIFKGWKDKDGNYVTSIDPSTIDEDFTLTADVEYKVYTVSYSIDGVVKETKTFTCLSLASYSHPTVPEKEGYSGSWDGTVSSLQDYAIHAVYTQDTIHLYVQIGTEKLSDYGTRPCYPSLTYGDALKEFASSGDEILGLWNKDNVTAIKLSDKMEKGTNLWVRICKAIHIKSAEQMLSIMADDSQYNVDQGVYRFVLDNDIYFTSIDKPLNLNIKSRHTLDGEGHAFKALNIDVDNCEGKTMKYMDRDFLVQGGFFNSNEGVIRNLVIDDCHIKMKTKETNMFKQIGGIIGRNCGEIDNVTIKNSSFDFSLHGGSSNLSDSYLGSDVGILVGSNISNAIMTNAFVPGLISACHIGKDVDMISSAAFAARGSVNVLTKYDTDYYTNQGGIAGWSNGKILGCDVNASLSIHATSYQWNVLYDYGVANSYCRGGGIVGSSEQSAFVEKCRFGGSIDVETPYEGNGNLVVGGLAGLNVDNAVIRESYVDGGEISARVNAKRNGIIIDKTSRAGKVSIGGAVGENKSLIEYSYVSNASTKTFAKDFAIGGFAGVNSSRINYCYCSGDIIGDKDCDVGDIWYGGFCGCFAADCEVQSCLALTNVLAGKYTSGKVGVLADCYSRFGCASGTGKFTSCYYSSDVFYKFLPLTGGIPLDYSTMDNILSAGGKDIEISSSVAQGKQEEEILTADFFRYSLNFPANIYQMADGGTPTFVE